MEQELWERGSGLPVALPVLLPGCSCLHTKRGFGTPYPSRTQSHTSHGQHWLLWVAPGWRCPCTVAGMAQVLQQGLDHGCSEHQACPFPFPGALSFSSGPELGQGHISTAGEMEGERDRCGRKVRKLVMVRETQGRWG